MALRRLMPRRAVGARIQGLVASFGKNGNIYLSNDLVEEFGVSTDSAAETFWDDEDKELVIHFVDREGKDRGALSQAGQLALVKQGTSLQLSAKSILLDAGVPLPEKSTRFPVEVKEKQLDTGKAKVKVACVSLGELLS